MKVGDAVWIRPDSPFRVALPLWADQLGHVAEVMQVGDNELRLTVTFCEPFAVDVSPLRPEDLVVDRSRPCAPVRAMEQPTSLSDEPSVVASPVERIVAGDDGDARLVREHLEDPGQ